MTFFLPKLPKNTDLIIDKIISEPVPKLKGIEGYGYNKHIKIWYENLMPEGAVKGTVLLVMGLGQDAFTWNEYFYSFFLEANYQVIRMDNRSTGLSDWMLNWFRKNAYDLSDMSMDCLAVLDNLKVDKVHVLGISLGGMVAQQLAIDYPHRVASLLPIMTTGFGDDGLLPKIRISVFLKLYLNKILFSFPASEKNQIKQRLRAGFILGGTTKFQPDIEGIARSVLYNIRFRKGMNPKSAVHQVVAIKKSGSRYVSLKNIEVPTLVIHGIADNLIPIEHSYKFVEFIKNAEFMWVEGMGHSLPPVFSKLLGRRIVQFLDKV